VAGTGQWPTLRTVGSSKGLWVVKKEGERSYEESTGRARNSQNLVHVKIKYLK
jgi:hypothetical protein